MDRHELYSLITKLTAWYDKRLSRMVSGDGLDTFPIIDPLHNEVAAHLPICDASIVDQLAKRCASAQAVWVGLDDSDKARRLHESAKRIRDHQFIIAPLLAFETGKAITTECQGEVQLVANIFDYFADAIPELAKHKPLAGANAEANPYRKAYTTRQPFGVVGSIIPWNVPLMFFGYKVATPAAAGNAVLAKLPEQASCSLLYIARLIEDLYPEGLLEVATGTGSVTGQAIIAHEQVRKVSFTGSVATGRHVYRTAADGLKPASMELGGKSAMVVLPGSDINKVVAGAFESVRFTRSGQSCTASTRIFVPNAMKAAFIAELTEQLENLRYGDPLDPESQCGTIVTSQQAERVNRYIESAQQAGIDVRVCKANLDEQFKRFPNASFVPASLVIDPPTDADIYQEEVFGPVTCILGYDDIDDVVQKANALEFGLSASVWGNDLDTCIALGNRLEAGIVQINQNAIMLPGFPYGGIKNSGFGKEGSSSAMIEGYTYEKLHVVNTAPSVQTSASNTDVKKPATNATNATNRTAIAAEKVKTPVGSEPDV